MNCRILRLIFTFMLWGDATSWSRGTNTPGERGGGYYGTRGLGKQCGCYGIDEKTYASSCVIILDDGYCWMDSRGAWRMQGTLSSSVAHRSWHCIWTVMILFSLSWYLLGEAVVVVVVVVVVEAANQKEVIVLSIPLPPLLLLLLLLLPPSSPNIPMTMFTRQSNRTT